MSEFTNTTFSSDVVENTETPVEVESINSNEVSIIEEAEPVLGEELHEEVTEVSDEVAEVTE
jgi:hypothetical protein